MRIYGFTELTGLDRRLVAFAGDCQVTFGEEPVEVEFLGLVPRRDRFAIGFRAVARYGGHLVHAFRAFGALAAVPDIVEDDNGCFVVRHVWISRVNPNDWATAVWREDRRDTLPPHDRMWHALIMLAMSAGSATPVVPPSARPKGNGRPMRIDIGTDIGDFPACSPVVEGQLAEAAAQQSSVHVTVDSRGGIAREGLALYDLLARHPYRVSTAVLRAESAALTVALAGDVRMIAPDGTAMCHRTHLDVKEADAPALARSALVVAEMDQRHACLIAQRCGVDIEAAVEWIAADTRFSAAQAVAAGNVQGIDWHIVPLASAPKRRPRLLPVEAA